MVRQSVGGPRTMPGPRSGQYRQGRFGQAAPSPCPCQQPACPHVHRMTAALSVLDLAPITEGSDAARSFRNSLELAQQAERLGYRRFWLAEHHGMPGIASAATAVL